MTWHKKKRTKIDVPDDTRLAKALRDQATQELAQIKQQAPYVSRLTARLIERRDLNHFGDDIQMTFTAKESHV